MVIFFPCPPGPFSTLHGPFHSKNSIICLQLPLPLPQLPQSMQRPRGRPSQNSEGLLPGLQADLCYLCLATSANFLGPNSGNQESLGQ